MRRNQGPERTVRRCAIYTRKSTAKGLGGDQVFTSLDAQRDACANYIRAMSGQESWEIVDEKYDDGGFTGANTNRPGYARLMRDIAEGKVDCVVVYRVDRLSRSLLDFAKMMKLFDELGITFVSTTERFDTTQPMGRMVLNILMTFAQYERETIAARTRDKVAAARRNGRWTSVAPYGYRFEQKRLVPHPVDAERARQMFDMYLRMASTAAVAHEANRRRWKRPTRHKRSKGEWFYSTVHAMLRNPIYAGKIRYDGEEFEGEHEAIVPGEVFLEVQTLLSSGTPSAPPRPNAKYLLAGVLRCGRCGLSMTSSSGKGQKGKRYRYYGCTGRKLSGERRCDQPWVRAEDVEDVVAEALWKHCTRPRLADEVVERVVAGKDELLGELERRRREAKVRARECRKKAKALLQTVKGDVPGPAVREDLGRLDDEIRGLEQVVVDLDQEILSLEAHADELLRTGEILSHFREVWPHHLTPQERRELVGLVIEHVVVSDGKLDIAFHDLGAVGRRPGASGTRAPEPACEEAAQ